MPHCYNQTLRIFAIILVTGISYPGCKRSGKPFKLEKIIFHSTGCLGTCSEYSVEIRSDKTIILYMTIRNLYY